MIIIKTFNQVTIIDFIYGIAFFGIYIKAGSDLTAERKQASLFNISLGPYIYLYYIFVVRLIFIQ